MTLRNKTDFSEKKAGRMNATVRGGNSHGKSFSHFEIAKDNIHKYIYFALFHTKLFSLPTKQCHHKVQCVSGESKRKKISCPNVRDVSPLHDLAKFTKKTGSSVTTFADFVTILAVQTDATSDPHTIT